MESIEVLWSRAADLEELDGVAEVVAAEILKSRPFCLWLQADMGSGKTTFTRYLMRRLGLPEHIPVQSPTYTIVNEYRIAGEEFAHIDFYRVGSDNFSLDELGVKDTRDYRGFIVEWPEVPGPDEALEPSHILAIEVLADERRQFKLTKPVS